MNDNQKAASILRQYAGELYQGHTIGGQWPDESAHIEREHDELIALADRLALAGQGEAVAWAHVATMNGVDVVQYPVYLRKFDAEWSIKNYADGVKVRIEPLYTHPAPSADRIAELEAQLAASREREGRMREALVAYARAKTPDEVERTAKALAALATDKEGE